MTFMKDTLVLRDSMRCRIAHFRDLLQYLCHFLSELIVCLISIIPSMAAWLSVCIMYGQFLGTVQSAVKIAANSALVDDGQSVILQWNVSVYVLSVMFSS